MSTKCNNNNFRPPAEAVTEQVLSDTGSFLSTFFSLFYGAAENLLDTLSPSNDDMQQLGRRTIRDDIKGFVAGALCYTAIVGTTLLARRIFLLVPPVISIVGLGIFLWKVVLSVTTSEGLVQSTVRSIFSACVEENSSVDPTTRLHDTTYSVEEEEQDTQSLEQNGTEISAKNSSRLSVHWVTQTPAWCVQPSEGSIFFVREEENSSVDPITYGHDTTYGVEVEDTLSLEQDTLSPEQDPLSLAQSLEQDVTGIAAKISNYLNTGWATKEVVDIALELLVWTLLLSSATTVSTVFFIVSECCLLSITGIFAIATIVWANYCVMMRAIMWMMDHCEQIERVYAYTAGKVGNLQQKVRAVYAHIAGKVGDCQRKVHDSLCKKIDWLCACLAMVCSRIGQGLSRASASFEGVAVRLREPRQLK